MRSFLVTAHARSSSQELSTRPKPSRGGIVVLTALVALPFLTSHAAAIDWDAHPVAEYDVLFDREFVSNVPNGPVKGIILAFPGCGQEPIAWGLKSRRCPLCIGLPEEMQIVAAAVRRQYAVITVGPLLSGHVDRCWHKPWPPEAGIEMVELKRAMRHLLEERKWWGLPRFFFGSSAGGGAALLFATCFPVQAVASMLVGFRTEGQYEQVNLISRNVDENGDVIATWPYPPVLLLEAQKDADYYKGTIEDTLQYLQEKGSPVEHILMAPYPLEPHSFSEFLTNIDPALSANLYKDLQSSGIINATGFSRFPHVEPDQQMEQTERELESLLIKHLTEHLGRRGPWDRGYFVAFREIFIASQAQHEIRGREMNLIIDFFERAGMPDLEPINSNLHDLVRQAESAAEVLLRKIGHLPGQAWQRSWKHLPTGSLDERIQCMQFQGSSWPGSSEPEYNHGV